MPPFRPYDAAEDALRRAEELLDEATTNGLSRSVSDDMRRSALVLSVAAVDTYMHRLIVDRFNDHSSLPVKLAEAPIRFDDLVSEADASYEAARKPSHNSRPKTRVKTVLRNSLLKKTFQSPKAIDDALSMAGLSGNWKQIGQTMGGTRAQIGARLNGIVARRNQMVHEGDYRRLDRPQNADLNQVEAARVRSDIEFLRDLAGAIHSVV